MWMMETRLRRIAILAVFMASCLMTAVNRVDAQTDTAGIVGRVVDTSGAVLPGVTVTATSPSLQVPQLTALTDGQGDYRFTLLPQGVYTVVYELQGFQTTRREGVRLGVGFVATVNAELGVGSVQETVTVTSVSPVVDVTTTAQRTQFIRETLEELPTTRNSQVSLAIAAPGVRISAAGFDVNNKFTSGASWNKFGRTGADTALLDGVRIGPQAGDYEDFSSLDEAQVQVMGSGADMGGTGTLVSSIVKSGGNSASGSFYYANAGNWGQSENLDDKLRALGLDGSTQLRANWDVSGDLGGRIFYNKLWFYMNGRRAVDDPIIPGADLREDGEPGSATARQAFYTAKLSWQASSNQRVVGLFQGNWKYNIRGVGPFNTWESRMQQDQYGQTQKLEWQMIPRSTMALNVIGGYWSRNFPTNGMAYGQVASYDQITQRYAGDHISNFRTPIDANVDRVTYKATMSWYRTDLLAGDHDFKFGLESQPNASFSEYPSRGASGDYYLVFRSGDPYQLVTYHGPLKTRLEANSVSVYAQDAWKLGRVVINAGLRFDRETAVVPEQGTSGGFNTNPYTQPRVEGTPLHALAPKLHFSWDVTGRGRTVVKGGFGRFNTERNTDAVSGMNGNGSRTTTYRWNDRNGNRLWEPGEADFSVSGADYVSGAGPDPAGTLRVVNPDERYVKQDEYTLSFEHELFANFGVRVSGVYLRNFNLLQRDILGRPLSSWTVPITRPDPGPDGATGTADDPGRLFTYYEYPTALRAPTFGQYRIINGPNTNYTKGIDLAATKRFAGGWQILSSGGFIWKDDEQAAAEQELNPNAMLFSSEKKNEWYFKAAGSYRIGAPDVLVSASFNGTSGEYWWRTVRFTGGNTVPNILLPVEPRTARQYPNAYVLDLRAQKTFRIRTAHHTHQISAGLDMFNALNVNTITRVNNQSGPAFSLPVSESGTGRQVAIMPARVMKASISYKF
jgi:hypothetical protein